MAQGSPAGGGSQDNSMAMMIVAVAVLLLGSMGFAYFYHHNREMINWLAYIWVRIQIIPAIGLGLDRPMQVWDFMSSVPPSKASEQQISALLNAGGQYGRWLIIPIIVFIGIKTRNYVGETDRFMRRFDMEGLLRHNAEQFAALLPVVNRKRLIIDEPTATGPWRVKESPMLFAIRRGIIVDENGNKAKESDAFTKDGLPRSSVIAPAGGFLFDEERAKAVFISRIGPQFPGKEGIKTLPTYIRGLIGAFCAIGVGEKKAGSQILDAMSTSYNEEAAIASYIGDNNEHGYPGEIAGEFELDIADADKWIERVLMPSDDEPTLAPPTFWQKLLRTKPKPMKKSSDTELDLGQSIRQSVSKHDAWLYVWMCELLRKARQQGGSTPPNEFIWLRPTNRPLWYALNDLGGDTNSFEAVSVHAHYLCEQSLGRPIPAADAGVTASVDALHYAIDSEGWFDMKEGVNN